MKKTVSFLLALLFSLTAFGVTAIFSGVIGAGAEFYDYFDYVSIPGFEAFTEEGIAGQRNHYTDFVGFTSDVLPEGSPVEKVATFTATNLAYWGESMITSFKRKNTVSPDDYSPNWVAKDYIDGTDIFGDTGLTFEGASGFTFWLNINGQPCTSEIILLLHQVPSQGAYYTVSDDNNEQDMIDKPAGAVYASRVYSDVDGYVYFDFKNFSQEDWWSTDDDGVNQFEKGITGIPKNKLPILNAIQLVITGGERNSTIRIGDFRICYDKRIHVDELDEYITAFDSLDPEAYTEESYIAASDAYLEAYEVYLEPESQAQVDEAVTLLRRAIADLKPLFHARNDAIELESFESWTEEELDEMSLIGLDTSIISEDFAPSNKDQSVMIMANATNEEPTYGYSWFASGKDDIAIGNPFALKEGSAPLSESSGIRFWIKWDDSFVEPPQSAIIIVGSSKSDVYFECEDYVVTLPETEGYIGVPWSKFFDSQGEADIYEYIDELDYIQIMLWEADGIYYISDLHAFDWDISEADFLPLQTKINETYTYLASLNEDDWYYKSWERVEEALANAESVNGKYGATEAEVYEAINAINTAVSKLVPIGELAKPETIARLNYLYQTGISVWRGNVTSSSYREMVDDLENAGILIAEGPSEENAQAAIAALDAAINALVPIAAGEKVTSIHSFESYTTRELSRANGDRTEGVVYSLANAQDVPGIPEGYAKALKMVATTDMSANNSDEHGVMQFKAMTRDAAGVTPIMLGKNNENTLIGDLTGTDGICLWIGVNDVNLVQDCTFRFAVSNCTTYPLFERAARDIPLPTTGSGWLYIPWEYFEFYDAWTNGEPIRLDAIYFYILRFNGVVKQGLEVYSTGIHAYKNTTAGEWEAPVISNIADGQTYDISETPLVPEWNAGVAALDGEYFIYGNSVLTNGEHTLEVKNGNKNTTVSFTVVGGKDKEYDAPSVFGVEDGKKYSSAVTLSWDYGTATLNGNAVERGAQITEEGSYTLVVTNGDKVTTVKFEIVKAPEYTRGDLDNDGIITVSDALVALRVAAKMAEETADIIAIGDADGDGKITVSDALAILRVAAKMADSI